MSAVGIMNMRRIAAGITGKAVDTTTTMKKVVADIIIKVTRMVVASTITKVTITKVTGKVAAVRAADITMTKLVFFE